MRLRSGALGVGLIVWACNPARSDLPSGDTMPNVTSGNTMFPCDVGAALQSKCWGCHGVPTNYGAPMSLTTWEDVHKLTHDGTEEIFQRMKERIHDSGSPMPPKLYPRLTMSETDTLDQWIDAGAPSGNGCTPPPNTGGGGSANGGSTSGGSTNTNTGGTGGTYYGGGGSAGVASGGTGGATTGGSGGGIDAYPDAGTPDWGVGEDPVEPSPDECDYLTFHARQDASGAKYNVPSGEQYYCFGFQVTLEAGAQSLGFYPEIDNTRVIHHWLLYKTGPQTDGTVNACLGFHPDGELIAGWAPGAGAVFFPPHVGQELGAGGFILEVHYNNTGAPDVDGSGVKVCKAKVHRPDTASVSWLGTEWISIPPASTDFPVTSYCKPNITEPIHILRAWPHMHKLGVHMTTSINRAAGGTDPLVDVDFDFNSQWQYDTPATLNTGDYLTTTCFYNNTTPGTITFGESTTSEMCYDFITAYPARALLGGGLHSTSCNSP